MSRYFKCTRPDGTDFRTGTVNYAAALASGEPIEALDAAPANGQVCGHGLHVSPTARQTVQFASGSVRPWRWFEVMVRNADVIEQDSEKLRVRRLRVVKEISLTDIFGADFAARIEAASAFAASWKSIPWLKPATRPEDKTLKKLFFAWHGAISPWAKKKPPKKVRIVRTAADAAAANANAAAANAAAAAAAAAADAAAAAAADAAAAAAAAAADAAADDAAADDAADDAAAAAADDGIYRYWYWRWYVSPRRVLYRSASWIISGLEQPSPWAPLVEMYRLGCLPIGYVKNEFVIYAPEPKE
jgi:hypothetical protein